MTMAQSNSSKKSQGLCDKIHNAVSPFRHRRISDQTRGSISVTGSPQTKPPLLVLHQSKTIPVELKHSAAHFSPQNSNKESDHEREIAITRGQKFAKSPPPHHVQFDGHSVHHEGKFSDYISKFKKRMMKTASHVGAGGGGGGGNSTRRDSFNDKVSNYIDQAKVKIRTTTNVGVDHNNN